MDAENRPAAVPNAVGHQGQPWNATPADTAGDALMPWMDPNRHVDPADFAPAASQPSADSHGIVDIPASAVVLVEMPDGSTEVRVAASPPQHTALHCKGVLVGCQRCTLSLPGSAHGMCHWCHPRATALRAAYAACIRCGGCRCHHNVCCTNASSRRSASTRSRCLRPGWAAGGAS